MAGGSGTSTCASVKGARAIWVAATSGVGTSLRRPSPSLSLSGNTFADRGDELSGGLELHRVSATSQAPRVFVSERTAPAGERAGSLSRAPAFAFFTAQI